MRKTKTGPTKVVGPVDWLSLLTLLSKLLKPSFHNLMDFFRRLLDVPSFQAILYQIADV
jgi:hypothetical protein